MHIIYMLVLVFLDAVFSLKITTKYIEATVFSFYIRNK
jgi:hypothetical protein